MKTVRWIIRLLLLAAALFFAIGGPLPVWMDRIVPALSPLALLAESVAQRSWYAGLFWAIPPLAVLSLAVWKGRFFCQWLCPLGTIYALPQKLSLKKKILPIRLNALIFWIVISASALGLPALLFLDPLSTFSRIGAWSAWIPGLLVPIFLLLSFFQPQVWCTHLCPLGYCFDLVNVKNTKRVFNRDRRQFIAGLGIGIPAALILPKLGKSSAKPSILPPGATEQFAETCTRCYACVSVCPAKIIRVKAGGGLNELFMPELFFDKGVCNEFCTRCTEVCPTGAIRKLTEKTKRQVKIGTAKIEKDKCLAWADNEYCMVCDEFCPYQAFETQMNGDIACPIVIEEACRGCGGCEQNCPAVRNGKAIFVHPIHPQQIIKG
ncbi:MAG: 4Fe-4S binding protein [Kiritimatiellales bacterium]